MVESNWGSLSSQAVKPSKREKKLVLSYELSWRTVKDHAFRESPEWRKIRQAILERDDFTCAYCGHRSLKGMHVNHVDGNPKNNSTLNLEVICPECHMITHSGLSSAVWGKVDCFAKCKYSQNDVIRISRKMRLEGRADREIIEFLGLEYHVHWRQDLNYLSKLYGFINSHKLQDSPKIRISEEQQKAAIENKKNW